MQRAHEHAPRTADAPAWSARWAPLAQAVELAPSEPVLVALSGGADSVLLLHLVAASRGEPRVFACHVDHGLRGAESRADAEFCAELCASLGVPLVTVSAVLEDGPDLEARARRTRYRALTREAARLGVETVLTGHHADDSLETLLLRWTRGGEGLAGPRPALELAPGSELNPTAHPARIVRPLLSMRRSEIRETLRQRGAGWREDSSNADLRFTRNGIRHALLPALSETCGEEALEHLFAFGAAVARLEDTLAERTSHLAWAPSARPAATRSADAAELGGRLARADLAALPRALQRRALVRLLAEGTGRAPGARLVDLLLADLGRARCTRRTLPGGWSLVLRSAELLLLPPAGRARTGQRPLPFPRPEHPTPGVCARLPIPGTAALEDGRRLRASVVERAGDAELPRAGDVVELDAARLPAVLAVRFARAGDRFRPLGGPGSRPVGRFLADAGVPREERGAVPLVYAGDELVWVAGVRPCHAHRVRSETRRRVRLELDLARRPGDCQGRGE